MVGRGEKINDQFWKVLLATNESRRMWAQQLQIQIFGREVSKRELFYFYGFIFSLFCFQENVIKQHTPIARIPISVCVCLEGIEAICGFCFRKKCVEIQQHNYIIGKIELDMQGTSGGKKRNQFK